MIYLLAQALAAVCPIVGVNSLRRIDFKPEATPDQRRAAQVIADAWDFDAEEAKERQRIGALDKLGSIDDRSIRSIREWIATQPSAPDVLIELESDAVTERAKLPPIK